MLFALAQDFSAVWADPATDPRLKKRVTRRLIEEIRAWGSRFIIGPSQIVALRRQLFFDVLGVNVVI